MFTTLSQALPRLLAQAADAVTAPATQAAAAVAAKAEEVGLLEKLQLDRTLSQTPWFNWFILLGMIFLGVVAGRIAAEVLRRTADRIEKHHGKLIAIGLRSATGPAILLGIVIGTSIGLQGILPYTSAPLQNFVKKVITLLTTIAVGWFVFNLVAIIDHFIVSLTAKTASKLDDQLAPMIRKTLRIFVCVVFILYIAQNVFDQNITAWLAGLGIAGLAVSLAAQDSIKNLFGSVTILLDKPFAVGDRIVFDGFEGPVEEIGFRSTKVRTLVGELATIPNSKFIDNSIKNVSKRGNLPKALDFTLRFDSSAEQIRQALDIMKRVANEPGIVDKWDLAALPPRAFLESSRMDAFNLRLQFWWPNPADWWGFVDIAEKLQLRIMEELEKANINFALPTQLSVPYEGQRGAVCEPKEPARE